MSTARNRAKHCAVACITRAFERHLLEDAFFLDHEAREAMLDGIAEYVELCFDYIHNESE